MGRWMICAALFLASSAAHSYTQTVTSSGVPVKWTGNPKLNLAGNPLNRVGIDAGSFNSAVVRSLQRWQKASGGRVGFDYWQGTDRSIYEPDSDYNGLSSIYFVSNAKTDPHLSPNVLGLTQVWYNTDSGEILETDVVLNDRDFHFTTDPRDTSGYGSSSSSPYSGGRNNVYIENVITHELGHAFGLSHSGGLQSTMLFMESPEQAHLGCDESVAIHAIYPTGDAGSRGAIAGSVLSDSGQPVFAAHVVAISRRRGTVLATALTDKAGHYRIGALEPGAYFLMVEPFFAGASALPAYYAGVNAGICPAGQAFSRSVLMDSGSSYRPLSVQVGGGGSTVTAPGLVARCSSLGGAVVSGSSGSSRSVSAPVVYDSAQDGSGFGVSDRFSVSNTDFYKLRAVSGRLEIHAMSYSLYSPIHPKLALTDLFGNPVTASVRVEEPVYSGDSGYVNFDSSLTADDLPRGDYLIAVSASQMDTSRYPAGPGPVDSVPFLVITGSVNETGPALAQAIPVNARCRMDETFASYSSPGGNPPRASTDTGGGTGFCGTIAAATGAGGGGSQKGGPRGPDDGPSAGAVVGWLLPWALMALIARLARAMAKSSQRRLAQPLQSG